MFGKKEEAKAAPAQPSPLNLGGAAKSKEEEKKQAPASGQPT